MRTIKPTDIYIYDNRMIITLDGEQYDFYLSRLSEKLANANKVGRELYDLNKSGDTILWPLVHEKLSVDEIFEHKRQRFIAYFDYLGFASIVNRVPISDLFTRINHNFRDIEFSLTDKINEPVNSIITANLEGIKCNCAQFSDTIVFYTDDFTHKELTTYSSKVEEQLINIIEVCHRFNHNSNLGYTVRGCLLLGELEYDFLSNPKTVTNNFHYYRNGIFGKGLVEAYYMGESQNWAGAFASREIIELLTKNGRMDIVVKYFLRYKLPFNKDIPQPEEDVYKKTEIFKEEYCFRLSDKVANPVEMYNNRKDLYITAFTRKQPKVLHKSVQKKLDNTLAFFKYCLEN